MCSVREELPCRCQNTAPVLLRTVRHATQGFKKLATTGTILRENVLLHKLFICCTNFQKKRKKQFYLHNPFSEHVQNSGNQILSLHDQAKTLNNPAKLSGDSLFNSVCQILARRCSPLRYYLN